VDDGYRLWSDLRPKSRKLIFFEPPLKDEFYARTRVGGKWLCVVVKYHPNDAFVVTAYLTDQRKDGEIIWPKR